MAAGKALSALIGLLAIRLAAALPTCNTDQYQVSNIVYKCGGSSGSVTMNQIKVSVPAHSEKVVATIPHGVPNFQAELLTNLDADLYIKDVSTGESIYKALPGGENPTGSSTRSGSYHSFHIVVTQSLGLPTTEKVQCTGNTPSEMQLVVRNNGDSHGEALNVGFFYDQWSSSSACPWQLQPHGCLPFNQADVSKAALDFSQWLAAQYGTCDQAWSALAVPQTGRYGPVAGVPFENWHNVYNSWPGASAVQGPGNMGRAMFKFVTGGGVENNKQVVRRSDFLWICGAKQMHDTFVQGCCSKLRGAFADENDAWRGLGQAANTNGHSDPQQGLWAVCRTLPNAPSGGRDSLFRFIESDSRHVSGPSDIKFCWPNGRVSVQPTTKPIVDPYYHTIDHRYRDPDKIPPWERDGSENTPAPAASASQARTAAPASQQQIGDDTILEPVQAGGTTPEPHSHSGTEDPYVKAYKKKYSNGRTPFPTITDYPPTTPKPGHNIEDHTSEIPTGVTMEPEFGAEGPPPSSTGPAAKGIGIAVGVGAAVAAAAVGTAAGVYQHVIAQQQGTTLYPGQASISARRETVGAVGSANGGTANAYQNGTGTAFPVLLLLGVFCGFLCCAGVVGAMIFFINKRRNANFDRELYLPPPGMGIYPPDTEDQEKLLAFGGYPGHPHHPLDAEAMHMMQ